MKSRVVSGLNMDEPIYRYFRLEHFEQALQSKELVLVNPYLWNDPYELIAQGIWLEDDRGNIEGRVKSCLDRCFCQCWSIRGQSDTLLQAYSRVEWDAQSLNRYRELEGVHVRTTPRKLINSVKENSGDRDSFIGSVEYGPADGITGYVHSLISRNEEALLSSDGIVELLLLKREAFRDEGEVRLICIEQDSNPDNRISVPFDPNYLFESVAFDPRLWTNERNEREQSAREAGYTGQVMDSGFYHPRLWTLTRSSIPTPEPANVSAKTDL